MNFRCLFILPLILFLLLQSSLAFAKESLQFVFTYEGKTFEQIIDRFSAQENIEVERLWSAQGDLRVNLLELIERGNAPDVVLIPADHIGLHELMNYSAIDASFRSKDIADDLWQTASIDGLNYGIPVIQGNHLMLYYNKKFVSDVAKTWDEIIQQKHLFEKEQLKGSNERFIAWSYDEMYWFAPFYGAYGGWPVIQGKIDLDNNAMIQALDFYKSLKDLKIPEEHCNYACARTSFSKGELAYTINGDWALKEFREKLGDDLGIAILPAISKDKPLVPYFSTHDLAFPNDSLNGKKRKELIRLLTYFQSPETQRFIWQSLGVLPVEKSIVNDVISKSDRLEKQMLLAMKFAKPMPTDSAMTIVWSAMRKGMLRHQAGVMSAEQAAKLMQKIADKQQQGKN